MSKHPIPDWLRSQFSRIEDEVQKLGPCGVFTQMRTVTQTYFQQQAEAAQPQALGDDLERGMDLGMFLAEMKSVKADRDQLQARCDELECDHEWTDDGEFNLHCTKCGKQENHEPYGWVQTRGNAINHFTQEWDVVEEWEAQGFEYKPMFDAAQSTAVEDDPVEYGPTPGCKQCQEAEDCGFTDCPECDAQLCEDVNGDGVRPAESEKV